MSLLDHAPQLTADMAGRITESLYGIQSAAGPLPSERDQNFKVTAVDGSSFILKIANGDEDREFLEMQNAVMGRLAGHVDFCPVVRPTLEGDEIAQIANPKSEAQHLVRLVTFIDGIPLGKIRRKPDRLLHDLGVKVGLLDTALNGFDHPAAHRKFHWDLARGLDVVNEHIDLIIDRGTRDLVRTLTDRYQQHTLPLLPGLSKGIIHNDANDYNVIVSDGGGLRSRTVTGLIDLGDMVYSHTINDLAIAVAYAILDKDDPLLSAAEMVRGYNSARKLSGTEFTVLYDLICLRLCTSSAIAAYQQRQRPDDEYLSISQAPIQRTLPKLAAIHPRFAAAVFREACDLTPLEGTGPVVDYLTRTNSSAVLGPDIDLQRAIVLDLSVGSPLIQGDPEKNGEANVSERISSLATENNATVAIGRYDEPRLLYNAPTFANSESHYGERRTIHLGHDLCIEAGAQIYAPLDGEIYSMADNDQEQDYGPVIICKHTTDTGEDFFTLYGHLSRASLKHLKVGQKVKAGDKIAEVGTTQENGNWIPHLHFQIVVDLLDQDTDFPGIGHASRRSVWRAFSPDSNVIVGVPESLFPKNTPSIDETLTVRRKKIGRNVSIGYTNHLKIERGWRQYLYDYTGRKYLDAYNNVPHVGHCHPRVVAAGRSQMGILNTNTRYLHDNLNRYAEKLSATLPDPLNVCFFVNSASEANELALRLARSYTGHKDLVVMDAAYHGHTTGLIDISPYKHAGPGGKGAPDWVHTSPIPDVYRGEFRADDPEAGGKYAQRVSDIISRVVEEKNGLCGYIAETCPSVGGQIFLPDGYLAAVYRKVRAAGGVTIADEVQTGYGRIGSHFYAFEAHDVVPDIVVLGKPIGNGHPIGAVVTTSAIADAFDNGMEFFSTFGGNTVSCAIGMAVLDVMAEEELQNHAHEVGDYLLARLKPMEEKYSIVGQVRGSGLFFGVELVRNRETLEPAGEEASFVANRMRELGILLGTDGPYHNVVKIRPPMPFTRADADFLAASLDAVLDADFSD